MDRSTMPALSPQPTPGRWSRRRRIVIALASLALIVALMCLPFGGLLLALGIAKWLRNHSLARRP